jgi:mannose/fructose/N-acetylgalactosamine-specific phosphotransferase system component IIC
MIVSAAQAALVTVLGGLVALDGTSVGQFMLSRPFVAASLGGLVVGAPMQGVAAGIVLEALHLAVLPVGAALYPEGGPAALVAGAVFAAGQRPVAVATSGTLLVCVLFALAMEWVGGRSVTALRQYNVRFSGAPAEGLTPGQVARRHWSAIGLDFVRGAGLALAGLLLLELVVGAIDFSGFPEVAMSSVLRLAAVAGLASALRLFGRGNYPLFLAGAAAGALVAWAR